MNTDNKNSTPGRNKSSQLNTSRRLSDRHSETGFSRSGVMGGRRGFLSNNTRPYYHHLDTDSHNINQQNESDEQRQIIWGTNIEVRVVEKKLRTFIESFNANLGHSITESQIEIENSDKSIQQDNIRYLKLLHTLKETEQFNFDVSGQHIYQFDKDLYRQFVIFPSEIIQIFDKVVNFMYKEIVGNKEELRTIQVRIHDLRTISAMRALNPRDINKLISIKGIVIRCSDISPEMKDAAFRCSICGFYAFTLLSRGVIEEPNQCDRCQTKNSFNLIHNLCQFTDKQQIKLQETPDSIPEGETPYTVTLLVYDDMVDSIRAGDRVEVAGIYRAQPMRMSKQRRTVKSVFNTYVDAISFQHTSKERFKMNDEENYEFDEQTKKQLFDLAQKKNIYDLLVGSLAPSIWEMEDVKKGILCQLFGGTTKNFSKSSRGRFRAEINTLLVGDPSTAKSQLLGFVHQISPRGIYTSGKGSSAVGLTAYVTKDPETGELILESGAVVLSDKGICCIDEFDKMDDNGRTILHEAMEQQTISIAKAGIVCQLNARTAILAAANPIESKYNVKRSVVANIRLPPTLLSRFDLIYLMLDRVTQQHDKKLAKHILSLYGKKEDMEIEDNKSGDSQPIPRKIMTQYISYARQNIKPKIPENLINHIVESYVEMRRLGISKKVITATPRQLESIIRLSEALAKMRFSQLVSKDDVDEAVRLIKVATQSAATDPTTGQIDMDMLAIGMTTDTRKKINDLVEKVREVINIQRQSKRRTIKYKMLLIELRKSYEIVGVGIEDPFTDQELKQALRHLTEENVIRFQGSSRRGNIKILDP